MEWLCKWADTIAIFFLARTLLAGDRRLLAGDRQKPAQLSSSTHQKSGLGCFECFGSFCFLNEMHKPERQQKQPISLLLYYVLERATHRDLKSFHDR